MPPLLVDDDHQGDLYECVAANHLNGNVGNFKAALRAYNGFDFVVPDDDDLLKLQVREGLLFWVLKNDTPDDDMEFLSEYFNAAQNQDQCNGQMHLMATVRKAADKILADKPHVATGVVIHSVMSQSVVKLRPDNVGDMAVFYVPYYGSQYVVQLEHWYSSHVNPKELTVPSRWFAEIATQYGRETPIVKTASARVQYSSADRLKQTRPTPDVAKEISYPDMAAVVKLGLHLILEPILKKNRDAKMGVLETVMGKQPALAHIEKFEEAAVTLMYSKSLANVAFNGTVSGKFTLLKVKTLDDEWIRSIANSSDAFSGLCELFGIKMNPDAAIEADGEELLCPGNFEEGVFHKNPNEGLYTKGFVVGAKVVLNRRVRCFSAPKRNGLTFK